MEKVCLYKHEQTMRKQNLITKLFMVFLVVAATSLHANERELMQTIRGKVVDEDSQMPLIGATIILLGSDPIAGTITNIDGRFTLENVLVGRIELKVSSMGYEEKVIPNILVGSGHEVHLNISLTESLTELNEVIVSGKKYKTEAANEMALLSSRAFTVEETKRYAGTFNDPARMVSAYAGVSNDPHGNNDIVVRGNASKGIQWRLEGIEIPNPNHFADEGMTGGPINALNSDMLTNSDFFTGAFAPEYGNALSGVFDMKLRTGNNKKREYSIGISALGTDMTFEGPFSKNHSASYLFNYRYSTLAILDDAGIVDFGGVPKYQDLSFKVFVPTYNFGTFSLFGLGGKSSITQTLADDNDPELIYENAIYGADMGVVGLNHLYLFNDRLYLKTSLSVSENSSSYWEEVLNDITNKLTQGYNDELRKSTRKFATTLNYKMNAKNRIQTGFIYTHHNYLYFAEYYDWELGKKIRDFDRKGNTDHYQSFVSWKYRFSKKATLVSGLHFQKFGLNNEYVFEPRVALKWQVHPLHSFHVGFGMHSKHEAIPVYFAIETLDDGTQRMPNKDLALPKARHYVLGYDVQINENIHAKIETYYQDLYDVPVANDINNAYSMINYQWGNVDIDLVNEGTGRNYGLEFTLERFFNDNYYYMFTASVFDSKYTALDGIERNTTFNGNYAGNILFGKEWKAGKKEDKEKTLGISGKVTLIGARRITPLDLEASREAGYSVYSDNDIYSQKMDDIFSTNLSLTYRINRKKTTHVIKLDVQNITNNQARIYPFYDSHDDKMVYSKQLNIIPNIIL